MPNYQDQGDLFCKTESSMSKKTIIYISAFLAGLCGLYVLGCLFSPSTMSTKDEIKISTSKGLLYVMLNDIKEWPNWLSWKNEDSGLAISLGGRHVNQGANFTFEGPQFGKGKVEIEESLKDSLMAAYITNEAWPGKVSITFQLIPENKTTILLTTRSRIPKKIPFLKRFLHRNFASEYEARHRADLQGLKTYIEGMISSKFGVESTNFSKKMYIGIKAPIYNMNIPKFYSENYPKVYRMLDSLKITPSGPPVGMIFDWEGGSNYVYIMAALPIDQKIKPPVGFDFEEVPDIPCLKMPMYGHYNNLKTAHSKMDYIMSASAFTLFPPIIEEYVTNPSEEPDTSKWLTNIYYLLDNTGSYSKALQNKRTLEEMIKEEEEQRRLILERENKRQSRQ